MLGLTSANRASVRSARAARPVPLAKLLIRPVGQLGLVKLLIRPWTAGPGEAVDPPPPWTAGCTNQLPGGGMTFGKAFRKFEKSFKKCGGVIWYKIGKYCDCTVDIPLFCLIHALSNESEMCFGVGVCISIYVLGNGFRLQWGVPV